MSTLFELSGFILLVIETLIGMVGNGFIAIVNFTEWLRSRKLSPADMILGGLALFRLALHVVVIQTAISILFFMAADKSRNVSIAYYSMWKFIDTAHLWFATWLSVLYCVKIANFSHPLFLQMKWRFPGLVPWLLLGTVVLSAISTSTSITGNLILSKCKFLESFLSNNSDSGLKMPDSCKYLILLYVATDFLPFMIFLSSSILLLTSLWRHKNLLRNSTSDVSTGVHLNAIKALASFSILYVSNSVVEILDTVLSWMGIKNTWMTVIFFNVMAAYSSGHTVILISINPKLKQESIKRLHQLKC